MEIKELHIVMPFIVVGMVTTIISVMEVVVDVTIILPVVVVHTIKEVQVGVIKLQENIPLEALHILNQVRFGEVIRMDC